MKAGDHMDQGTQTFGATVERHADGVLMAFRGQLDISSVPRAEAELERAESHLADGDLIVVDLRALDFMDSTGLRFILGAQSRAKDAGHGFAVVQGPDAIERLFRITRVDAMVDIVADPAERLRA